MNIPCINMVTWKYKYYSTGSKKTMSTLWPVLWRAKNFCGYKHLLSTMILCGPNENEAIDLSVFEIIDLLAILQKSLDRALF